MWIIRIIITVGPDLTSGAVSGHAGLTGALIRSVLQSYDRLPGLEDVLVESPLVLGSHFDAQNGSVEAQLLGQTAQSEEIVDDHVEVLVLVEVVNLEEVLRLEAVGFAGLQVELDILALLKWSLHGVDLLD